MTHGRLNHPVLICRVDNMLLYLHMYVHVCAYNVTAEQYLECEIRAAVRVTVCTLAEWVFGECVSVCVVVIVE